MEKVKLDLLFETSWEVCNKIGGIYAVLSTKAKTLQKLYKDKVIFIGPDVWSEENPSPYFVESAVLRQWRSKAELPDGISVRVGRWDIPGKPIAILVKFDSMYALKDQYYGKMWELFGVDSLHAYGDYDEACAFALAAAKVIESIVNFNSKAENVIAHFDEWTTGMGLLYTKWTMPKVATIFTTHATSIGRSICGNNKPLYDYLKGYNGDQMAAELNMQSKHSLEKAAAHAADCFTTVSEVTAAECEQLLEIRPHVVTPNGFEQNFVPSKTKFDSVRVDARRQLLNVASSLTGKNFDDSAFLVATSGRCEYRNKGIDIFLDSLNLLRSVNLKRKVVAFVLVPSWVDTERDDLSHALGLNRKCQLDEPFITHKLHQPSSDAIYNRVKGLGLDTPAENLSVIYVPSYLNGSDGIFNKSYYDLLIGFDATVFPSYYEPWGYTPLESIAFGVPTITTSLSGFGQWILSTSQNDFLGSGVKVVARNDSNYSDVVNAITADLVMLDGATPDVSAQIAKVAATTAGKAAWDYFIDYYIEAFDIALKSADKRKPQ